MKDLNEIRARIDEVDAKLIALIEERMLLAEDVARYKMATGKAVYDSERESAKIEAAAAMAHNEFNAKAVKDLFSHIMTISRLRQYQMISERAVGEEINK